VAYHYWKCYHRESSAFQTASLYSVEVDYYHFGTCEIVDGSYFCGDHSCSSYKYIGDKNVVENKENTYPTSQRYAQKLENGLVNRMDNAKVGQYQKFTGRWLNASAIGNPVLLNSISGYVQALDPHATTPFTTPLHLLRNLYPGLCAQTCSDDVTCKMYQESRWEINGVVPTCWIFHMPYYRSSYTCNPQSSGFPCGNKLRPLEFGDTNWWEKEGSPSSDQAHLADVYLKISNPKGSEPWLHIPKTTAPFPQPIGQVLPAKVERGPGVVTARDPVPPQKLGRRLNGVY